MLAFFVILDAVLLIAGDPAPTSPSRSEVDKLVDRYFDAPRQEQLTIEERLDLLPALTEKEVATWKEKLLKRAKKGKKAALDATNYFYDAKAKTGKYLVGGDTKSTTLVISMHGGGLGSGEAEQAKGSFESALAKMQVLAIYPEVLHKTEHGWGEDDTERFVIDLIEAVKRTRPIDPNHIYLTGHSMGGYGTYTIGAHHADMFGGLAAFAGAPTPYFDSRQQGKKVVFGIEDGIVPNLRNVPLFFYQSLDDKNVSPEVNVYINEQFPKWKEQFGGYDFVSEIVDGRGHGFPEKGPLPGIKWAMSHPRDPRPKRVLWQPAREWTHMSYWLWWESPELAAKIDASIEPNNKITIKTPVKDLKKFAVFLDERLVDMKKEVVVTVNDSGHFSAVPKLTLSTLLRTICERDDADLAFPARIDLF